MNNLPFRFTSGGYTAPSFGAVPFRFSTKPVYSQTANLTAAIDVMQTYQDTTYTFLKYCERYVVGYQTYGVQIIKGRCFYGGIRDMGARVGVMQTGADDLPASVRGLVYRSLLATIVGETGGMDLPASIRGLVYKDLSAIIEGEEKWKDLAALVGGHLPADLTGYIRGFVTRDLSASVGFLFSKDFPASIGVHLPGDLSAYLKVWPQKDLPASLYSWQESNLAASVVLAYPRSLPAYIGVHDPGNLRGMLKGWVREATYDLGVSMVGFGYKDLPVSIRATYLIDLGASLYGVPPRGLSAFIYGWQTADLSANIIGDDWPWNLRASIASSGGFRNLTANISPRVALNVYAGLTANVLGTRGRQNLTAYMNIFQAKDLTAFIDTGRDIANLAAVIYPKMIRLTGVLSIITMEHKDLSATISIPCFYSDYSDIGAYLRPIFLSNLTASIYSEGWDRGISNLGARWGYAAGYVVQDKLPINISLAPLGYRTEDKLKLYLQIYRSIVNLTASIFGEYMSTDLPAYVYGQELTPYNFDAHKNKETVIFRNYMQAFVDFEEVDIHFEDIVRDYIYSSTGNIVAKADRYQHFLTRVSSYYSPAASERLDQKLHKVKILYDLRKFDSIDEAMKYAIDYVTLYPYADFRAYINAIGKYINLNAFVNGITTWSTAHNLNSYINGTVTHPYDVVLGFTDDGVGYLQF